MSFIDGEYRIIEIVHEGKVSTVFKAVGITDNKLYIVKALNKNENVLGTFIVLPIDIIIVKIKLVQSYKQNITFEVLK